ncbi:glycosyltransferase [Conexibacter woesei]|uniref:glycosyltransferase n=1 Tax=Conexibacter woesei TaxID=191495 RepID=UPI00040D2916|nr:glycosyltransferase [Conexibacter woesei]
MTAPSVAVLVAAYEAAPYVGQAVRSALAQDYAGDVHVVVVDDGSTDGTGDVVAGIAEDFPGRVTLVRQENRGSVGAVNRCAEQDAALRADFLAILDADDAWPANKLTAQIALLASRPEVGLVYGDMRVIDGAGQVVQESWLADARPPSGRSFSTFLRENLVTGSSIVVRGGLRDVLFPIPDDMAWADWWLAVRASQFAEIAYLPIPRTLYRFHGTNMSLGAQGAARLRELRRGLRLQRWFLRRVDAAAVPVEELERAWDAFARVAAEALSVAGTPFVELVCVSDEDRAEAASLVASARELLSSDQLHEALAVATRAAAADPPSDDARGALLEVRAQLGPDAVGPQPLRGARPLVACVAADDLLRDPALLRGLADTLGDLEDVTLAVDAVEFDASEAAARISALADEQGFADDPRLDLALVVGPLDELGAARLRAGLTVRVGTRRPIDGTPWFAPDDLAGARAVLLAARG